MAYLEGAETAGFIIRPESGADLQKIVNEVFATPTDVIARARAILAPGR